MLDGPAATAVRRRSQRHTRNVPSWREVAPGASERSDLDLSDGTREGEVAGTHLVAAYDATPPPEAEEHDVLTGPLRRELAEPASERTDVP